MPEEDFHLSDQARFQAHVGTLPRVRQIERMARSPLTSLDFHGKRFT